MGHTKISALPAVTTLSTSDQIPVVSSGVTKKATIAQVSAMRALAQSAVQVTAPADTNFNSLATITVPGGAMGPNGRIEIYAVWQMTNNANGKLVGARVGSASGTVIVQNSVPSQVSCTMLGSLANRGVENAQVTGTPNVAGGLGVSTTAINTTSVDTSEDFTIHLSAQKSSAGDAITLESYRVLLYPGA